MGIREEAIDLHKQYQGKLGVVSKVPLASRHDLSLAYTPGVAEPCKDIKENKDLSFEYTCRGNMVAIVSDGTRVLGLGDIGPEAAMPVLEGKAVLFKVFGDVDAVPICLDTKDPAKIIETVRLLQPTFAGINLEDLSSRFYISKFYLSREYRKRFGITIGNDITAHRISLAKSDLRFSDRSVDDIGRACGFSDADYFIRQFKRSEGTTPLQYRRSWR